MSTDTPSAASIVAAAVAEGRTIRLDRFPVEARGLVRTIGFRAGRSRHGAGVITGIAARHLDVGDTLDADVEVLVCSAGCAHGDRPYVIPAGSIIERAAR